MSMEAKIDAADLAYELSKLLEEYVELKSGAKYVGDAINEKDRQLAEANRTIARLEKLLAKREKSAQ